MEKYIVYQTTNKINNKIYIGVHCTTCPDKFDGYIGCGVRVTQPCTYENPKTVFQKAVKKYGVKAFVRTTLKVFDNEEDAYALEAEIVNEAFLKRSDVYNLTLGGKFHVTHSTKVYMYDIDGNFEKEFNGIHEAGRYLNKEYKENGHLSRAIKEGFAYYGHLFSYEKVEKLINNVKHRKLTQPVSKAYIGPKVGRYDKSGNLLEIYNTMTECVKAGYSNAKKVALNQRKYCKGFIFKYLD